MPSLSVALPGASESQSARIVEELSLSPSVTSVFLLHSPEQASSTVAADVSSKTHHINGDLSSTAGLSLLLDSVATDFLLIVPAGECVEFSSRALERFCSAANESGAGLVYSDYLDNHGATLDHHPLIDYQFGSIRDGFNFGSVVLISMQAARAALDRHGAIPQGIKWGAFYDLRLKLSIDAAVLRVPEPLYTRVQSTAGFPGQFDYVDPRHRDYQIEMEKISTDHLKRIGAWLAPEFEAIERAPEAFPVRASIVIPVRNRERTIADAVKSALAQEAPFKFNVIVVDNHSSDRTTDILKQLSGDHPGLVHLAPKARDLGIGGCWNEAVYSPYCGEYAVQLDSDDLYKDRRTLQKIVDKFQEGPYAMVIGSYTIVNFDLVEIPPGLIDHSEWTRENGRNNALRINGLGAPRAFYAPVLRQIGFPNTSYGEDYAVGLRIARQYEIGRIYESIYYARRWEGNSDAALDVLTANRYDSYKDWLRTMEIRARKRVNGA